MDGELIGYIQMLSPKDSVSIYRVGDKLTDSLRIPKQIISGKIKEKYDVSTTPEFEILFIINEELYEDYQKYKSKLKPSTYYKIHNKTYKKQSLFVKQYFQNMTGQEILHLIDLYVEKHGKVLHNNQITLKDLMDKKE